MENEIRNVARNLATHTHVLFQRKQDSDGDFKVYPIGTCFFISQNGYLLTCAHGISASMSLHIAKPDTVNEHYNYKVNQFHIQDVEVVAIDSRNDIALLKMRANVKVAIANNLIGNPRTVFIGDDIIHLGYPFMEHGHYMLKMARSMISSKLIDGSTKIYIADGFVYGGNSGGPVFSLKTGKIIGLVAGTFLPFDSGVRVGNVPLGSDSSIIKIISIDHIAKLVSPFGIYVDE